METITRPITADEFLRLPEDGCSYELVKGELRRMAPSGGKHGIIGMKLGWELARHVAENRLGVVFNAESGFILSHDPDTVRAPDLAFVKRERIPKGDYTEKYWPEAPDLAVEVVSPHDTLYEIEEKIDDYLKAGVSLIWLIRPKTKTATVHQPHAPVKTLNETDVLEGGSVVPGFRFELFRLFSYHEGE